MELQVPEMVADWPRTALWAVGGLVALTLLILVVRLLFRLWALVVCLVGGAACMLYFNREIEQIIRPHVTRGVRADVLAYIAGFLAGYLICLLLFALLRAPLKVARQEE